MNMRNWPPEQKPRASLEVLTPDDIEAELEDLQPALIKYFKRLPPELWARQFHEVKKFGEESIDTDTANKQREKYMEFVLESREKAIVSYEISDESLQEMLPPSDETRETLKSLIQETFASGKFLGAGTTAHVLSMVLNHFPEQIAVKYLLTPGTKTLSVDQEHKIIHEVETMARVEAAESKKGIGERIRVPHPYFWLKRGGMQCYGMHEVDGVTVQQLSSGVSTHIHKQDRVLEALRTRYSTKEAQKELLAEADTFIDAMHEVCLHGDIKFRNIMVDTEGIIYIIDFGQAVSANTEDEKTRDRFGNLRDQERENIHIAIQTMLRLAFASEEGVVEIA